MSIYLPGNDLRDRWFRVRSTDVGSTLALTGVSAVMLVVCAIAPGLPAATAFWPGAVAGGDFWRVLTWPFVDLLNIWAVLNLFFLWVFGTELEQRLGKNRMAVLFAGMWAIFTLVTTAVWLVGGRAGSGAPLIGLQGIEFALLLLWIAEYPRRPFFFGIPAWVVGAVLAGLQVLDRISHRDGLGLLSLLISSALIALLAKQLGLLSEIAWIPGRARSTRRRPSRRQRAAQRSAEQSGKDTARLDELLDQISERGMDSLTPAQRRELMKLRNRR